MRSIVKVWAFLIVLFLVLTHATSFERDVRAIGHFGIGATKALQGRG